MQILPRKPRLLWIGLCATVGAFLLVVWSGLRHESAVSARAVAISTEARAHWQIDAAESPRAMERLNRIRHELVTEQVPDWAGEYSWSCTYQFQGCLATDPETYTEGFALAPKSGAVWWFGMGDPSNAGCVDHGDIAQATESEIVVNWTLNPEHAHTDVLEQQQRLDRILVRLGPSLVPASRMPVYCAAHVRVPHNLTALAPRRGGWDATEFAERARQGLNPVVSEVPDAWRGYVLSEPLSAPCSIESAEYSPALWSWTRFLPRRDPPEEVPEANWQPRLTFVACTVPLGMRDGLLDGMPMYFVNRYPSAGRVVQARAHESRVEFIMPTPHRPEDAFRSGEIVSTQPRGW